MTEREEAIGPIRKGVRWLRDLFLPSSGLMIGEVRLAAKDDGDGNIDPYWCRPDGTESNLSIGGSAGGAPADVDYLVGTADGDLSAEIVVGTTPGGELGGSWASPTVDATHSGSVHHAKYTDGEAVAAVETDGLAKQEIYIPFGNEPEAGVTIFPS